MAAQRRTFAVITPTCTTIWSNTTRKEWKKPSPTWRRGLCCFCLAHSCHTFSFYFSFFYASVNHPFHLLSQRSLQFKDIHFLMCLHFFLLAGSFSLTFFHTWSIIFFLLCLSPALSPSFSLSFTLNPKTLFLSFCIVWNEWFIICKWQLVGSHQLSCP